MPEAPRLEVARAGRAHGLRGEVVVALSSEREERLAPGAQLYDGDRRLTVATARRHRDRWLVRFEGIEDRDGADTLAGRVLSAPAIPGEGDDLWVHEMIGLPVEDRSGLALGTVRAVQANPASDLLVLDGDVLVPLTFLVERHPDRLVVDPPDGLLDL